MTDLQVTALSWFRYCTRTCPVLLAILDPRVGHNMDILSPFIIQTAGLESRDSFTRTLWHNVPVNHVCIRTCCYIQWFNLRLKH